MDLARFKKALDSRAFKPQVERDRLFANKMGITAAPAFYINGRLMLGIPQTYEALKARIAQEIAAARKVLAKGVKRAGLYDHLIKQGKTTPVYKSSGSHAGHGHPPGGAPPAGGPPPAGKK